MIASQTFLFQDQVGQDQQHAEVRDHGGGVHALCYGRVSGSILTMVAGGRYRWIVFPSMWCMLFIIRWLIVALNANYMAPLVTLLDIPDIITGSFDKTSSCCLHAGSDLVWAHVWHYYADVTCGEKRGIWRKFPSSWDFGGQPMSKVPVVDRSVSIDWGANIFLSWFHFWDFQSFWR